MNMHYHQAKYDENGKLLDECALCGKSFRDTDIHISYKGILSDHFQRATSAGGRQ